MPAASILLSLLFLSDDPVAPSLAVTIEQRDSVRVLQWALLEWDGGGRSGVLREDVAPGEPGVVAMSWPLPPQGASLVAAHDGLLLTIEDAGDWQGGRNPPANGRSVDVVPVAGARTLRLFVPDASTGHVGAGSLHGARGRYAGQTVVVPIEPGARAFVPGRDGIAWTGALDMGRDVERDTGCAGLAPVRASTPMGGVQRLGAPLCAGTLAAAFVDVTAPPASASPPAAPAPTKTAGRKPAVPVDAHAHRRGIVFVTDVPRG